MSDETGDGGVEPGAAAQELDLVDFVILRCLSSAETPLWKSKIFDCQNELFDDAVSVQTVGRRVDRLHEQGLVETCIVSPDDIKRDLIIAFQPTEYGEQTLHHKRRELLLNAVRQSVFDCTESGERLPDNILKELVQREFGIPDTDKQVLRSYSRDELVSLVALYFTVRQAEDTFTTEDRDRVVSLAQQSEHLSTILTENVLAGPE